MKINEVRAMSREQSQQELSKLYKQEAILKMKIATREVKNTALLGTVKKTIARILTCLSEKGEV